MRGIPRVGGAWFILGNRRGFSMAKAIALRTDHGADDLRRLARASRDAAQTRRLLALAAIRDGASRTEAARIGGVGLQIVRDWVLRFDAEGLAGLVDRKVPGRTPLLTSEQRAAFVQALEAGPKPEVHGAVRWRLVDLARWLQDEFGVSLSRQTLGRELRRMGFGKLSARPRDHAQDPEELEAFKKTFPPSWKRSGRRCRRTPQSRSGGRTKHGQARRTASRADGRGAARGPARRTTSAPGGPTSSAPSVRPEARRRAW